MTALLFTRSLSAAFVALLCVALSARAASITWSPPVNIARSTDVNTAGELVHAVNVGGSSVDVTVNGVTFVAGTTGRTGVFSSNAGTYSINSYLADTAPFTGLPSEYRTLLQSAIRTDAAEGRPGSFTLTLEGLSAGTDYLIQIWLNDSRSRSPRSGFPYSSTVISAGESVTLRHNVEETKGGLGQHVLGWFSATAPTQAITFTSVYGENTHAMLTAFQLRALSGGRRSAPSPAAPDGQVQAEHEAIGVAKIADNTARNPHPDAQWFPDAGLGLFIHWGTASVRAVNLSNDMIVGRALRGKRITDPAERERIIREKDYNLDGKGPPVIPLEYWEMAKNFNPKNYDPDKWLATAREAGFTYAVFTAKHHEGFAMWPSDAGDFSTKTWMGGRDLVGEYVEACRRHGLKVGLYFSPPDWYFDREYKNFLFPAAARLNPEFPPVGPDMEVRKTRPAAAALKAHQDAYRRLVRTQLEELLTRYGKIDLLWFDGSPEVPNGSGVISLERIRELQPGIVVNTRLNGRGDFATFERFQNFPKTRPSGWAEFCDTGWTNSWGYVKLGYRAPAFVLGYLPRSRAWGMNYLINVGPTADGELAPEIYQNLKIMAGWMKANGPSIKGAGPLPDGETASVPATAEGGRRYLFVIPAFDPPDRPFRNAQQRPGNETLVLSGVPRPSEVVVLATGQKLEFEHSGDALRVSLPAALRTDLVDVVRVTLPLIAPAFPSPAPGISRVRAAEGRSHAAFGSLSPAIP